MPLILAVLTFAVFIGIGCLSEFIKKRFLSRAAVEGPILGSAALADPTMARAPTVAILPELGGSTARVEGYALPKSLHYHQGHAWVAVQESGTALIGIDDFTAKLFGQPNSVALPRLGERFRQGEKGWTLSRGGKDLDMIFPLDGQVIAVNELAAHSPELLSKEPYGRGWLVMVKTKDLKRNLRNLLRGSVATKWMEESAAELRSMFSGKLGPVFQDGGLPEEGLADQLKAADWRELAGRIFMVEPVK